MCNIAIIAVGYNKRESLNRLLHSLNNAVFGDEQVPLIISLDYCGSNEVKSMAESFEWRHGKKEIRAFEQRQGLRKHILSCGDYLEQYDAVYIFEDDLVVAPLFYQFGKLCVEKYMENKDIAGVSLYGPQWNQNSNFPFEPMKGEFDTYFMQLAQSWGQIWFKEPWREFIRWYGQNMDFFDKPQNPQVPAILYSWGQNSWLRYHIAYCALMKKYFVYPYDSYTTVYVENGTHFGADITRYHVRMDRAYRKTFEMAPFHQDAIRYDAFMESLSVIQQLGLKEEEVTVDLYGCQDNCGSRKYLLTTRVLPYEKKAQFGLQYRPVECNVYEQVKGESVFLYDTEQMTGKRKNKPSKEEIVRRYDYFMKDRFLMWHEMLPLGVAKMQNLFRAFKKKK